VSGNKPGTESRECTAVLWTLRAVLEHSARLLVSLACRLIFAQMRGQLPEFGVLMLEMFELPKRSVAYGTRHKA
jgi:hypothetical protein